MADIDGRMTIDLGPDPLKDRYTLKASFNAHRQIENRSGKSILEIMDDMRNWKLSLDTTVIIVEQGIKAAGTKPPPTDQLLEKIWSSGLMNEIGPIMQYLSLLISGGKPENIGIEEADNGPPTSPGQAPAKNDTGPS